MAGDPYLGHPTGIRGPVFHMPEHLLGAFTLQSRMAVLPFWFGRTVADGALVWTRPMFDRIAGAVATAVATGGHVGYRSDPRLFEALRRFPVADRDVLIVGSETPQYECVVLHFGGRPFTVEYTPIRHDIEGLRTCTPEEFALDPRTFDTAMSISSIEHSGLGRYGDMLDPLGDLRAMQGFRRRLSAEGRLFLQVPVGYDAVYWNAHRVYGHVRLPLLLSGWRVEACLGLDYPGLGDLPVRPYDYLEPVFVLRNTGEPLEILGVDDLAAAPPDARLFLYGCGRGGRVLRAMLESGGRTVSGFIDSDRSGTHDGLPLMNADTFLADRRAEDVVIIASQHVEDIRPRLRALPPANVLSGRLFIRCFA